MNAHCTLSIAALLLTLVPLRGTEPQDGSTTKPASATGPSAQELERIVRDVLGEAVDKKAEEIARRLRGGTGDTSGGSVGADDDEGVESDVVGGEDDESEGDDALLQSLTTIDQRLCAIEGLLVDLSARGAPPKGSAASAAPPAPVVPTAGSPVTAGFDKARVRIWFEGKEGTVKLAVNGIPAGRFDSNTTFDLGPFLTPGRMNQIALTVEPRGKDVNGMALHVEGMMAGAHEYVAVLQFQPTKERLADTFDLPWAPR